MSEFDKRMVAVMNEKIETGKNPQRTCTHVYRPRSKLGSRFLQPYEIRGR